MNMKRDTLNLGTSKSRCGMLNSGPHSLAATVIILAVLSACTNPQAKETRFLETGKKHFEAKDYKRAILDFLNAAKVKPTDAEPHFQLALIYLAIGDGNSAVKNLRQAATLDPQHPRAQLKLAELMAVNRDLDTVRQGEELAKSALEKSPDNPDALSTLAMTELRLGKPEDAEKHLLEALKNSPQHLKSSLTLATIKLQRKDFPGAEEVLRKAVNDAPMSAVPIVALGRLYVRLGKLPEAEEQFKRAIQLDPKNGAALLDLAALQVRTGQRDKAEQTYKALSALPDKEFKPLHARFLFWDGQRAAATSEFETLVKQNPEDRALRTDLVAAYVATNRLPDGEKIITAALKRNPKDKDALLQRGELYLRAGKYAEAQTDLIQAPRESPQAHFLLSKVYQANGSTTNQRQELGRHCG